MTALHGSAAGPVGGPFETGAGRWGLAVALLLAHGALTLGLSTGLARDELESMLFAQGWAWGYDFEQPPLYNWLQMAVTEAVGPSLAGSILLRWGIIAAGLLALYDAIRRMAGGDAALAAGAVAGMAGTALFGFEGARHFTHTTLALTATAGLLWAAVRVVERPSAPRYVLLGLALTAALLSKYTLALFAVALGLGVLADPVTRARLFDRRILWAAVVPLLALPGHLLWRLGQSGSLADRVATITDGGTGDALAALAGLARNVVADPLAGMAPPLVLILVLLPWWRKGARAAAPPAETPGGRWDRVLLVFVVAAMALTLAVVLASGGDRLRYHYLMPAALVMPAIPLLWWGRRGAALAAGRRRALGWGLAGLATLFVLGSGVNRLWIEPATCGRCLPLLPSEAAAAAVRDAGFTQGTIVAGPLDWGANLRPAFPEVRLIARHYPDWRPSTPPGTGACLILLSPRELEDARAGTLEPGPLTDAVSAMVGAAMPADWLEGLVVRDLPLTGAPDRTIPFGFVLVRDGVGDCR
ncbi:hypothetical protein F1188_13470 [Roseospira marina]|uniref:Glycosyltransferase RgtA/B/C/D-like domain-containing protein n=1 Tax=Roseospira marina TaxID=140057 RepID=A0A5M6IBQ2_9PROT|nr:glycosyltransferase family 39 protein [Roseospira marina]KAA5605038.1 hypothetical protein F1188_13470 [Roseospira marina]MBB4314951.1 4-amino-4-deoxy-L-arabinose transferase-like glycosyltransferase [Roseospira marina]MBB5087951.1 4-amino-4-deoxy-L-arabinose transferase-like glycosyltransferase [Roseospira marina]